MSDQEKPLSEMREEYLKSEFWVFSWSAALGTRNISIYNKKDGQSGSKREEFKKAITEHCECYIIPQYVKGKVDEKTHCKNIEDLLAKVIEEGKDILIDGGFRIGNAQKLLNLQLKYLWCWGMISEEPPHCPVDRKIIDKVCAGKKVDHAEAIKRICSPKKVNWTEMTEITEYKKVIDAIREKANGKGVSIAFWELKHYSRGKKKACDEDISAVRK